MPLQVPQLIASQENTKCAIKRRPRSVWPVTVHFIIMYLSKKHCTCTLCWKRSTCLEYMECHNLLTACCVWNNFTNQSFNFLHYWVFISDHGSCWNALSKKHKVNNGSSCQLANALDSKSSGHGLSPGCDWVKGCFQHLCYHASACLTFAGSLHTLKIPCHLLIREGLTARGKETHR